MKPADHGNLPPWQTSRTSIHKKGKDDRSVKTTQRQELYLDHRALPIVGERRTLKTYVEDADQEGDQELMEFFNGVLENNLEANQRAKELLVPRLQREQE